MPRTEATKPTGALNGVLISGAAAAGGEVRSELRRP